MNFSAILPYWVVVLRVGSALSQVIAASGDLSFDDEFHTLTAPLFFSLTQKWPKTIFILISPLFIVSGKVF